MGKKGGKLWCSRKAEERSGKEKKKQIGNQSHINKEKCGVSVFPTLVETDKL